MKTVGWLIAPGELTASIDYCRHRWSPLAEGQRRCEAECGVVVEGALAPASPERGMDWSRAVLVEPGLAELRRRIAEADAIAERGLEAER